MVKGGGTFSLRRTIQSMNIIKGEVFELLSAGEYVIMFLFVGFEPLKHILIRLCMMLDTTVAWALYSGWIPSCTAKQ